MDANSSIAPRPAIDADSAVGVLDGGEEALALLLDRVPRTAIGSRDLAVSFLSAYWKAKVGSSLRDRRVSNSPTLSKRTRLVRDGLLDVLKDKEPETVGSIIGRAYSIGLGAVRRSELGAFHTPPALAIRLLEHSLPSTTNWSTLTAVDPACGTGALLLPVIRRTARALRSLGRSPVFIQRHIASHIHGCDIDPLATWLTNRLAELALFEECGATEHLDLANTTDSLVRAWKRRYDLVLCNPPYGRIPLSPPLKAKYQQIVYGHANKYSLFISLCVSLVRTNGSIGLLTPASYLSGRSHRHLRSELLQAAPPKSICFDLERKRTFADVQQEVILTVLSPGASADAASLLVYPSCDAPVTLPNPARSTGTGRPWMLPRTSEQGRILSRAESRCIRLGDLGVNVSTGPLVWNRKSTQLRTRQFNNEPRILWAEQIRPGGELDFSRIASHSHVAWPKRLNKILLRDPAIVVRRTTAPEESRRLVVGLVDEGVLAEHGPLAVENHVNIITRGDLDPTIDLASLFEALRSPWADAILRCVSGSNAVSAYELEALLVPSKEELARLAPIIRTRQRPAIDHAIRKAYGMDDP